MRGKSQGNRDQKGGTSLSKHYLRKSRTKQALLGCPMRLQQTKHFLLADVCSSLACQALQVNGWQHCCYCYCYMVQAFTSGHP
jgi:hypothetical protein